MRGEDDRPAGAPEGLDRIPHDERGLGVQGRCRLVEEDDRRIVEQGTGDGQLLLHALAERAGHVVPPLPQAEQPQIVLDPLRASSRRQPVQPREEIEIGARRQLVVEARRLGQDTDPGAHLLGLGSDIEAVDGGRAFRRPDECRQQPDGRRLARAVGAEETQHLALSDLEIHAADRPPVAEPTTQADATQGHG
ncbi:MAG: hypothetical protein WKF78_12040 [Candidatus Limnocylindrales bacterium]